MTKTNLVTSLELSKEIYKAGLISNSVFVWWYTEPMATDVKYGLREVDDKRCFTLRERKKGDLESGRAYPAYLTDELLNELPTDNDTKDLLTIHKHWQTQEFHVEYEDTGIFQRDKSLPNALAKMYIYLKKENLI